MINQLSKPLSPKDFQFYDYNLPILDKQIVVKNFIDFKDLKIIKSIKHSPDKRFSLLEIDGKRYVFVETDYFEIFNDTVDAKKLFKLNNLTWLIVNNPPNASEDLSITYDKTSHQISYLLATIK